MLEKELESATEAGLELERMFRELVTANNAENPLAQSVEDLQKRLNDQQHDNESLTAALLKKTREVCQLLLICSFFFLCHVLFFISLNLCIQNEQLTAELTSAKDSLERLEEQIKRTAAELKAEIAAKDDIENSMTSRIAYLEAEFDTVLI